MRACRSGLVVTAEEVTKQCVHFVWSFVLNPVAAVLQHMLFQSGNHFAHSFERVAFQLADRIVIAQQEKCRRDD